MRNSKFIPVLLLFLFTGSFVFSQKKDKKSKKDEMVLTYSGTKKTSKGETSTITFTNDKKEKVVFDWIDKNKPELMKIFYSSLPTEDDDGNYDMTVKENVGKKYLIKWHKSKLAGDNGIPGDFMVITEATEIKK